MLRKIKIAFAFSALLYLCILNWNCTKIDTTNIGAGLIPAVDNVHTFDTTMEVVAINFVPNANTNDTLACDSLDRHRHQVVGTISNGFDPLFGGTTAAMYFQILPTSFPYHFAARTKVNYSIPFDTLIGNQFDSVILQLNYKKTWGDSTVPQTLSIYQLPNPIDPLFFKPDSVYTSCNTASPGTLLKTITFVPQDLNKMSNATDSGVQQLRIDLTAQLRTILYNADSVKATNGGYASDSLFKANVLSGLAIIPGATGKALTYFDLDAQNTRLAIYYRYKKFKVSGAPENDTIPTVSYFKFTGLAGQRNTIIRDHSGAEIASHNSQPPAGDNFIYIQTAPGTYAKLKIPALNGFPNSLIHRAELVLDQAPFNFTTDSLYSAPEFLFLETLDPAKGPAGYRSIPCDFQLASGFPNFSTFGGYKTTVTDGTGTHIQYVFNISRYIQNFITFGKKDIKLRITAPYHVIRNTSFTDECGINLFQFNLPINEPALGRVRLKGGNNANPKLGMHLRIIYSKL